MGNKIPREQVRTERVKMKSLKAKVQLKVGLLEDSQSLLYSKDWKQCDIGIYLCTLTLDNKEELLLDNDFLVISRNQPLFELIFLTTSSQVNRIYMIKFESSNIFLKITAAILLSKRPSWIMSPVCQNCSQGFGMFTRDHHCRYCGKNICANCSKFCRLDILGYINVQRVCIHCPSKIDEKMNFICEIRHKDMSESVLENLYDLPYNQSVFASTLESV